MPTFDMSAKWPNGNRVAVMLTLAFAAETLWMSREPENAKRAGVLSQGRYGANVGVPKILDTLEGGRRARRVLCPRLDCRDTRSGITVTRVAGGTVLKI